MAIAASARLQKAQTYTQLTTSWALGAAAEVPANKSIFVPVNMPLTPPPFTVNGTITGTSVVATNNGFADVKVGNKIAIAVGDTSGATLPSNVTVIAKDTDNSITLSAAATANGTGAAKLLITPLAIAAATLFATEVVITIEAGVAKAEIFLLHYDGTLGASLGTVSNFTSRESLGAKQLKLEAFLKNLQVLPSDVNAVTL